VGDDLPEGSAGWHLNRAWRQGMATPELDVARVHKTLHHTRPRPVPLLDNKTAGLIVDADVLNCPHLPARRCCGSRACRDV
jgi:hypothetical protein